LFCLPHKASLTACLFLLLCVHTYAQEWTFDARSQQAYDLVMNLQTEEARALLPEPKTAQEHYVVALSESIELLLTEDGGRYSEFEDHFEALLDRKTKLSSVEDLFLQAEIGLQWAFVHLKFGHEFDAALNLRQAYQTTQEIKQRFPKFTAIQKTSGLLDVIIGSVPEKYDWILGLLDMEGSVEAGIHELESIRQSDHALAFESSLLYALTQGFVLQKPDVALTEAKLLLEQHPSNRLALFLGAAVAIKNNQSADALNWLTRLNELQAGIPLYYADYLRGEVYLHKAEYLNAISGYRWFINHYKGQNYMKDAHYKIGMCYWLNGNVSDAQVLFKQAKTIGKEATEADKYAARSLAEDEMPNIKLTQARYYTDGGYYPEAESLLHDVNPQDLVTLRDKVEFAYRKARLAHRTNQINQAKEFYQQTIKQNGEEPWYFAPNSCLQLGYIYRDENNLALAKEFFTKALGYKKHEYKNSIDSKAKSALTQLNKRK